MVDKKIRLNTILHKATDPSICLQEQGDFLIVLSDDISLTLLNSTSKYIYYNCEGKTVGSIGEMLFQECIDKEDLNKQEVISDCIEAIESMVNLGLITYEM